MQGDDLGGRLRDFIREHDLLRIGQRVVVGVSGGVDSLVLLHLLREDYRPVAAHVHHGLREDADQDAAFVEGVARSWGLESRVIRVEVPPGASRMAQARRARYAALERLAVEEGVDAIAVAHQRDDVAETLLLQLVRGAGPRGWRAMPVERPVVRGSDVRLVRPLRFAHRREIVAYAEAASIEWREDPSNEMTAYRRAVIRQRVLPLLEKHFGSGVAGRLASAAELAEAYADAGAAIVPGDALREALVEPGALSVDVLERMPPVVRRGVILEVLASDYPDVGPSARRLSAIESLLEAQPGRRADLGDVVVWRERDVLRFAKAHIPPSFVAAFGLPGSVRTPWGTLTTAVLETVPHDLPGDPHIEIADAAQLQQPLLVRTWQEGDRLRPLGLKGSKKVSDLLTERRVPSSERAFQLVVTSGDEIVWVVGHRLAAPFAVRPGTERAARLEWAPGNLAASADGR